MRYADDFVILARTITPTMVRWVEATVEEWLGLTINRRKTRQLRLAPRSGETITFLGYTFGCERDQYGRSHHYLVAVPSVAAVRGCWQAVRQVVHPRRSWLPVAALIREVNQLLRGWAQYFQFGYSRRAYRRVNAYVVTRLTKHLQRRSQRPCRPPADVSYYRYLTQELGLRLL